MEGRTLNRDSNQFMKAFSWLTLIQEACHWRRTWRGEEWTCQLNLSVDFRCVCRNKTRQGTRTTTNASDNSKPTWTLAFTFTFPFTCTGNASQYPGQHGDTMQTIPRSFISSVWPCKPTNETVNWPQQPGERTLDTGSKRKRQRSGRYIQPGDGCFIVLPFTFSLIRMHREK